MWAGTREGRRIDAPRDRSATRSWLTVPAAGQARPLRPRGAWNEPAELLTLPVCVFLHENWTFLKQQLEQSSCARSLRASHVPDSGHTITFTARRPDERTNPGSHRAGARGLKHAGVSPQLRADEAGANPSSRCAGSLSGSRCIRLILNGTDS